MVFNSDAVREFYCWADEKVRQQFWQDFLSAHVDEEKFSRENFNFNQKAEGKDEN